MTNVESSCSMVFFHDRPGSLEEPSAAEGPLEESVDYLVARERAERAAAKSARSIKARHVHQELAQYYASRVRQSRSG